MVKGLDKFKEYFKNFPGSYVIIGGTACDMIIGAAGLTPRATKDIVFILPESIQTDLQLFVNTVKNNLPDPAIFKEMGAGNIDAIALFNQLVKNFDLIQY